MFLPFFHKYPYTNFEQLNLDWLMEHVGAFDDRLNQVEATVTDLNTRVDTVESDVSALQDRMTDAEGDILSLGGRVTTNENDISDLKGRMDDAESDIADIKPRLSTTELNITTLDDRITTDESTINGIRSDLNALDAEVDAIPIVSANPGGSGSTLNTIEIGGTVYSVPTGGGGGGGSSVTPNPSGTPTDDLNSVDIDGTIYAIAGGGTTVVANPGGVDNPDLTSVSIGGTAYDIPVTDITQVQNDITSLDGRLDDAESDIDDLESATAFLDTDIGTATLNNARNISTWQTSLGSENTVTLGPGTYILHFHNRVYGDNVNEWAGMNVEHMATGLPTSTNALIRAYDHCRNNTACITDLTVMVTLTQSTTIGISTWVCRHETYITEVTVWSTLRYVRIR